MGNNGLFSSVSAWIAHPFNSTGSALTWLLFVGLIIVAIWFWQSTLLEVTKEL
jgi:hypothetical protein